MFPNSINITRKITLKCGREKNSLESISILPGTSILKISLFFGVIFLFSFIIILIHPLQPCQYMKATFEHKYILPITRNKLLHQLQTLCWTCLWHHVSSTMNSNKRHALLKFSNKTPRLLVSVSLVKHPR